MTPTRLVMLLAAMLLVGLAVALWCAPWCVVAARRTDARTTADEPQYLLTAISLGEDGDLDISDERADGRFRDFHEARAPDAGGARRADGSRVSPHDPLLPALLAVPVRARRVGRGEARARAARRRCSPRRCSGSRCAASPCRSGSRCSPCSRSRSPRRSRSTRTQVYPELPAALAVTVAIGALTGPLRRRRARRRSAATLVALPWLSVKYAPVVVVLAAIALRPALAARRTVVAAARSSLALGARRGRVPRVCTRLWYGGWTVYAAGGHFVGGELDRRRDRPRLPRAARVRARRPARRPRLRARGLAARVPARRARRSPRSLRRRPPGWAALVVAARRRLAQRDVRRAHDARLVVARPPGRGRPAVRGARRRVVGRGVPTGAGPGRAPGSCSVRSPSPG